MSRILISNSALTSRHHNKAANAQPAFVSTMANRLSILAAGVLLSAGALAAAPTSSVAKPATVAAKPATVAVASQKDPLAGDTWHAVRGTWPGTLVFNSAKKSVVLAPVGATPMQATYSYTVKPSTNANVVEGTLKMTNTAHQVSNATFRIEGKNLALFYSGQRPELFERLTPKEEEAEKARLKKMIAEGLVRPIKQ